MMWYEPFKTPAEWALNEKSNINAIFSHWNYYKYNPTVLRPFLSDGNYKVLTALAYLYRKMGATADQKLDLIKLALESLSKHIDSHIAWKYNKSANDEDNVAPAWNEFYHKVLELGLLLGSDATNKIIANYNEVDDHLKDELTTAIIHLYGMNVGEYDKIEKSIDRNYAETCIRSIIKELNVQRDPSKSLLDHVDGFSSYAYSLLKHTSLDIGAINMIFDMIADHYEKCENCNCVKSLMPEISDTVINDIYSTVKYISPTADVNQDTTACMIMHSGYSKEDLCKVTKLCINNLNHFNEGCISKSCEEAILKGIMDYKPANELSGLYDIDYELTILESITISDIAVEASNDEYEEEEDEDYTSRRSTKSMKQQETESNRKTKYNDEGYDLPTPKRDFDSEYRKFKGNVEKVTASVDKVAATIKNYALGTNASRGERKVLKTDSLSKVLARLFGTIAIFSVSKFLGVLFIIVRLANSKKTTERERVKIISEIRREINIIDDQINNGSVETPEARTSLLKTKQNLQDALNKIQLGMTEYMSDDSKKAVQDMRKKNKVE